MSVFPSDFGFTAVDRRQHCGEPGIGKAAIQQLGSSVLVKAVEGRATLTRVALACVHGFRRWRLRAAAVSLDRRHILLRLSAPC
jgi:hypothetical protein